MVCFHSIGFPSEWGRTAFRIIRRLVRRVSIQLVSPASGDRSQANEPPSAFRAVSIQLVSPASGDLGWNKGAVFLYDGFPFNWFPQRVGTG